MCGEHELEPLPQWMMEELENRIQAVHCIPALGIHERCEHVISPPRFSELTRR